MLIEFHHLKNNLETKVFLFFSIAFFLAFQGLSYFSLWVETEIYPVNSSWYLFTENRGDFLFSLKPVFYLILYLSSVFSDLFSLIPMTGARFLFALNGFLTLFLMYLYIKKKTNRYNAVLAVLTLASASIFLDRGFRVRSDLLLASFSLIILLLTLNIKEKRDHSKFYIVIPLLFSLLLISPKGIYWFFFTLSLMLHNLKNNMPSRWLVTKAVLIVCTAYYFLSILIKDPFFLNAIYSSSLFYFSSFKETWQTIFNLGLVNTLFNLSHIGFFAERNLFLVFLVFVKLLFVIYSVLIIKRRKGDLSDLFFFLLLIVLLFHPQQKLFFLCAVTPFILIAFFTDWQWKQLLKHKYSLQFKTFFLAGVFLYSVSYISHFSYKIYTRKNNHLQKELIEKLNGFYKNTDPLISIFDPACLIYTRKTNCRYILDDTQWTKAFNSYFRKQNFDLVLASRSLDLFELIHYKQSSFQYININNHIYYKALIIDLKKGGNLLKSEGMERQKNLYFKKKGLSGKKLLQHLLSSLETKIPEKSRKYSYFFLDSHNKPLKQTINCHKKEEQTPSLQQGCLYSKEEFKKGFIPYEKEKLALLYLPFPADLSNKLSLRALFRFDLF